MHVSIIMDTIILFRSLKNDIQFVSKFGRQYIKLDASMMDDLCAWIEEMRKRFFTEGRAIFDPSGM